VLDRGPEVDTPLKHEIDRRPVGAPGDDRRHVRRFKGDRRVARASEILTDDAGVRALAKSLGMATRSLSEIELPPEKMQHEIVGGSQ